MRVINVIVRACGVLLGLVAIAWGLAFWYVVARDNPQLLAVSEIQGRIVVFVLGGAVLIISALLFWWPPPKVRGYTTRVHPPPRFRF